MAVAQQSGAALEVVRLGWGWEEDSEGGEMINTRNNLGTRGGSDLRALALGLTLAIAALALLARGGAAQRFAERFDFVGTVVDAENGEVLVGAWVSLVGSDWGSITDDRGRFRIPDLAPGRLGLAVEQLGYEELTWEGEIAQADGLLELRLTPQPLVLEGLQIVSDRFRSRRAAVATSVFAYDKGDLSTTSQQTALDFIRFRSGTSFVSCAGRRGDTCILVRGRLVEPVVYIDEAPVLGGLEYLDTFGPHELYMIEIYAGGRHIRVYTPRFMERSAKRRLQPIALLF